MDIEAEDDGAGVKGDTGCFQRAAIANLAALRLLFFFWDFGVGRCWFGIRRLALEIKKKKQTKFSKIQLFPHAHYS